MGGSQEGDEPPSSNVESKHLAKSFALSEVEMTSEQFLVVGNLKKYNHN